MAMRGKVNRTATTRVIAFTDRLHAGGAHRDAGSMNFLIRRSSQWADIADYPEPCGNVWEHEKNQNLQKDTEMAVQRRKKRKRGLLELRRISPYHRFLWMAGRSTDRDMKDMRVKDDETPAIDPMVFSFVFDIAGKTGVFEESVRECVLSSRFTQ